jgi:hypothetical protein
MDITQWYAVALGGVVALSITAKAFLIIFKYAKFLALGGVVALSITAKAFLIIFKYAKFYFLKYVYYPQIHKHLRGSEKTTGFDVLLIAAFLVGNGLCTTIRVKDIHGLTGRSGLMSIINLMPLSLGASMNLIASRCGIKLGAYARTHRWLGRVAIVEGLIHTAAAVSLQKPDLRMPSDIAGLTVGYV